MRIEKVWDITSDFKLFIFIEVKFNLAFLAAKNLPFA